MAMFAFISLKKRQEILKTLQDSSDNLKSTNEGADKVSAQILLKKKRW